MSMSNQSATTAATAAHAVLDMTGNGDAAITAKKTRIMSHFDVSGPAWCSIHLGTASTRGAFESYSRQRLSSAIARISISPMQMLTSTNGNTKNSIIFHFMPATAIKPIPP